MPRTCKHILRIVLGLALLAELAVMVVAQTPVGLSEDARGVIRLRVRVALGDGTKAIGLSRKRFFLIRGSLQENSSLVQNIGQRSFLSRDCYYRSVGASEALLAWLKKHECESVYCAEVGAQDVDGPDAVPEFQHAVAAGEKDYGSREVARKWLTVNLADDIKIGFYRQQQQELCALLKEMCPAVTPADEQSKPRVMSVMTDGKGTGFFTELQLGTYVVSNIIQTELGDVTELWSCEVSVRASDLATQKPLLVTNPGNKDPKDKNITGARRCVSIERPLPACPATVK